MLGLAVGQQDVNGPARRTRDALGDGSIARRGEVRSTHRGVRRAQEPSGEVGEPVRIWVGIVVLGRLIAYDNVWGSWSLSPKA